MPRKKESQTPTALLLADLSLEFISPESNPDFNAASLHHEDDVEEDLNRVEESSWLPRALHGRVPVDHFCEYGMLHDYNATHSH